VAIEEVAVDNFRKKILIIKLGAMGDALRTTTILSALKDAYKDCHITWVTDKNSYQLLKYTDLIDRLIILDAQTSLALQEESFDLLLSFDEAKEATILATLCQAKEKGGFCITPDKRLSVFNKESEYALRLGLDDDLKFRKNKKTYPQIIFEMAGLAYKNQEYILGLPAEEKFCQDFLARHAIKKQDTLIGIFPGCGIIFPTKKWSVEGFARLIDMLGRENKFRIVLLGGPEEIERNKKISSLIHTDIIDAGCDNTMEEFINIINLLDLVVAGDTLALHLAIALKKRIVGIFTSTCSQEIELYGRGEIIKAEIECSPCYKAKCDSLKCLTRIKPEVIFEAVKRQAEISANKKGR
jgi:heptosyltransferase-2